jgi:DNA-binding NarL/FixJ family response regulator
MQCIAAANSSAINVLFSDSNQMQSQLLVAALRRRTDFKVSVCPLDADAILEAIATSSVQVAVINAGFRADNTDLALLRRVHLAQPEVAKILLLDAQDRDSVVNAFRSGARGLFCFSRHPFRLLCRCIQSVHEGQVWASSEQLHILIEALAQVPSLRVVNAQGNKLLTPREEQVVALVADGLSNREVARELDLSEHTVKKYLFRIFDKLGISSRVELVLYAVSNGAAREAEWVAGPRRVVSAQESFVGSHTRAG